MVSKAIFTNEKLNAAKELVYSKTDNTYICDDLIFTTLSRS
jgi:hypothetical protein